MVSYTIPESLGKTAPPANVKGQFRGSIRPFGIELLWSPVPDLDLDYYEIRLGNTWSTATFLQRLRLHAGGGNAPERN